MSTKAVKWYFHCSKNPLTQIAQGQILHIQNENHSIKNAQHEARMSEVRRRHENRPPRCSDSRNIRIYVHHFHHIHTKSENNGDWSLKSGVSPLYA